MSIHPAQSSLLEYFAFTHLPEGILRDTSEACALLANHMTDSIPDGGPELTAGLRHLLEAKDCFVRSALPAHRTEALIAGGGSTSSAMYRGEPRTNPA